MHKYPPTTLTYTPAEKKQFFKLMDRLLNIAGGYPKPIPHSSTIALLNDTYWIKYVLAPETPIATNLIHEWMLKSVANEDVVIEKQEIIFQSKIKFTS